MTIKNHKPKWGMPTKKKWKFTVLLAIEADRSSEFKVLCSVEEVKKMKERKQEWPKFFFNFQKILKTK